MYILSRYILFIHIVKWYQGIQDIFIQCSCIKVYRICTFCQVVSRYIGKNLEIIFKWTTTFILWAVGQEFQQRRYFEVSGKFIQNYEEQIYIVRREENISLNSFIYIYIIVFLRVYIFFYMQGFGQMTTLHTLILFFSYFHGFLDL